MFGRATIRLGIGPHSSVVYFYADESQKSPMVLAGITFTFQFPILPHLDIYYRHSVIGDLDLNR